VPGEIPPASEGAARAEWQWTHEASTNYDVKKELRPDDINRSAWSVDSTVREFGQSEGWTDPGESFAMYRVAPEMAGKPILDIGVGGGRTTPLLRNISADYVAIDFSPAMVELCRLRFPDAKIELGDARDLSAFGDDSFSLVVFSFCGIDAVDHGDRQKVLSEVHRVLKKGGVFLLSTHNKLGPGHGEKPWTVRTSDLKHPDRLVSRVLSAPRNLANYRQYRPLQEDHGDWSMMNAMAHDFGIVIHYTTLSRQLAELVDHGFRPDPEIYESSTGRRVAVGEDTHEFWWFHLLARK
jgi:ubiquinone/menaquinone biosynthesis C-methylase UbiE